MRRIKLAIVATCTAVTAATITPAQAAEEQSYLAALSTAIEKDGLVKTIESGLDSLSLIPLGLFLLLSSEPGVI